MAFYKYICDDCTEVFETRFYYLDGKLYNSENDKELSEDDLDHYECPSCKSLNTERILFEEGQDYAGWANGNTDRARRRFEKFNETGMNKQQAREFYQDSIQASKERVGTMGEVYKQVNPDMAHMVKHGVAKKVDDKRAAEKKKIAKENAKELIKRKERKQ